MFVGTGWAASWFGHGSCKALVHQTKKATEGKKKQTSTSPNPHGSLTYQDCNHDADILGILPKYITRGDFCKVCQSAKEHQKAQHLNQRSGLQRERGPRSGQPRAALALFTQIRMLRQSKKKKKSHYKSFFSGFCCWLFYRLTYATLNSSFRLLLFVRFPATCKLKSVDLHVYRVRIQGAQPQIPMWNKLRLLLRLPFFPLTALYFCCKNSIWVT